MNPQEPLQREVLATLQREQNLDATQIRVSVTDGIVTLTGLVPIYAQKFIAEHAARRVPGVKALVNDLNVPELDHGSDFDTHIASAVVQALSCADEVPSERIRVTVRDGWITLEGTVEQPYQREVADRVVRSLLGARGLTNDILIQPKPKSTAGSDPGESACTCRELVDSGGDI